VATQEVKIPAIKKELIRCKNTIQEININMNNILVDEYSIRWNCIPVEGAFRNWFKLISYNSTKLI
jgi:hypothetical protein